MASRSRTAKAAKSLVRKVRRNAALSRWYFRAFGCLEAAARPGDGHHRAVVGERSVGKRDLCAGAFQQRAGDEHAEPEPAAATLALCIVSTAPARQIGFADPPDDLRCKA